MNLRLEKRKKDIILKELDSELLLYDKKKAVVHYLNRTAGFIWKKINNKRSADDIAKEIEKKFDIPSNRAIKDVKKTLARFSKLELLNK